MVVCTRPRIAWQQSMPQPCLCYCSAAAFNIWFYTDENTETTYAFGNHLVGQGAAEDKCQSVGGHLVTWCGPGFPKIKICLACCC